MLQDRVLTILERNRGEIITGGAIARALGVSRTAVWKAVAALREGGSEIESIQSSGYRLSEESDALNARCILDYLETKRLGRSIEILATTDSTNRYLSALDTRVLPEGYTVIAQQQTHGKGRLGRPFYSPQNGGIYMSVLLKPQIPLAETPLLTVCAAVAVSRAIESLCGIEADIKWVNDIYYKGKKLCGILTEASISAEMQTVESAIVGIGINTVATPEQVRDTATSIHEACGMRGIRNCLTSRVLTELERVYLDFNSGKKRGILKAYREKLFILGKQVKVSQHGETYIATAESLDNSGRLTVKRENGETVTLSTGEVQLISNNV